MWMKPFFGVHQRPPPLGTGNSASVVPGGASAVPVVDGIGASIVCDAGKT